MGNRVMKLDKEEFKIICDLVARLTEIKIKEVPHLSVENFASELLGRLVMAANPPTLIQNELSQEEIDLLLNG